MSDLLHHIDELDKKLLLSFNGMHNAVLDFTMYWLSDKYIWVPLYSILIFLIIRKFKIAGFYSVISIVLMTVASEMISSWLFKPLTQRIRPCNAEGVKEQLHFILGGCGDAYSFFSSHASDTFGLATFIFLLFGRNVYTLLLFVWAFLVSISRVYLGKHYPTDVLAGILCGILLGYLFFFLYTQIKNRVTTLK